MQWLARKVGDSLSLAGIWKDAHRNFKRYTTDQPCAIALLHKSLCGFVSMIIVVPYGFKVCLLMNQNLPR